MRNLNRQIDRERVRKRGYVAGIIMDMWECVIK